MENKIIKHSGNAGDAIYSLSSLRDHAIKNNIAYNFDLLLNQPSGFTDETHPLGSVMMNEGMANFLKPLLESQDYINEVNLVTGAKPMYYFDLDRFRKDYYNLSAGNIQNWIANSYPELRPNLSEQCLFVEPIKTDYILVNRTTRYNNIFIDYTFLDRYENVYFIGLEKEFKRMAIHSDKIKHLPIKDAYEMAQYIAGCKLFIGGQSMAFAIAEQLKVKRVLEQYILAPNVIPQGGEWYTFHTNDQFKRILVSILK